MYVCMYVCSCMYACMCLPLDESYKRRRVTLKSVAADVLKKKAGAGKSASVLPYSSGMYVSMHVHVCMYVCMFMYLCMYVCPCMYVCMYVHVCMYVCMHVSPSR